MNTLSQVKFEMSGIFGSPFQMCSVRFVISICSLRNPRIYDIVDPVLGEISLVVRSKEINDQEKQDVEKEGVELFATVITILSHRRKLSWFAVIIVIVIYSLDSNFTITI